MQKFWAVLSILLIFSFNADLADAKRLGGGKSFGKTHKVQPAKPAPNQNANQAGNPNQAGNQATPAGGAAAPAAGKGGMLGGLMGGLLAGGLLGYLLGSGGFEGFQFGDMLIFGLLAFAGFMIFRKLRAKKAQPATAAPAGYASEPAPQQQAFSQADALDKQATQTAGGAAFNANNAANDVPFNLPSSFDEAQFLSMAKSHYLTLQEAWNNNNFNIIKDYLAPGLEKNLKLEREETEGQLATQILAVEAQLVRADYNAELAEVSLAFSGSYRDDATGEEGPITDIWHLERDLTQPHQPWLIVGIETA